MELTREYPVNSHGLLYPMMVIAAVAVIVFSIAGIATITGWMPNAMQGVDVSATEVAPVLSAPAVSDGQKAAPAFQCAECGVIESIREIERRGSLFGGAVAKASPDTARAPL
jgi:hypothetical protein